MLFISVFAATLGLGIIVPLLPIYAESMGATGLWIGAIFAAFSFSRAIFMPIVGSLSDRRGRRYFIIGGLVVYTLLSLAYIAATTVWTLTLVRFLHGLASAMVIPIAMAYSADLSPEGREGHTMGTFMVSLYLGLGCGPLLGGVIRDLLGMEAVFLAMSLFSAISLLVSLLFLPEYSGKKAVSPPILAAVTHRVIKPVLFFRVMNAFATGTFMVFFPLLAARPFLDGGGSGMAVLSTSEIGVIISVSILTTAVFQRLFGRMADRHSQILLIFAGTLVLSGALALLPLLSGFLPLLTVAFIFGAGSAISIPSSTSLIAIGGREVGQGAAMGAYNTAMSVGMISAPLFAGLVMDLSGIGSVFIAAALLSGASGLIFLGMARKASLV
ncbi:MAG: MFS transporter [Methanomicrobiaceae archaeon]|nr:MFS transporter [Methanomicrobiaceae archaeon]